MAFDDVYFDALDEAESKGTLDINDSDSLQAFEDSFSSVMVDEEGNERDHFPSAEEISKEDWDTYIDFLDEYDLWDVFRDEWEDYEKAA